MLVQHIARTVAAQMHVSQCGSCVGTTKAHVTPADMHGFIIAETFPLQYISSKQLAGPADQPPATVNQGVQ